MEKNNLFLLSFFLIINFVGCRSNLSIPDIDNITLNTEADSLLYDYIKSKKIVGVSAGVLKGDKIIWQNAFGFSDVANKIIADTNMVHRLASVTKPMTSVAILQLVENGKLNLDEPIQKYLPKYPIKEEGNITIRQLLNHTSGTPAYKFFTSENRPTKQYKNLKEALSVFKDRALLNTPGKEFNYSSYGYTILGAIIEQVSGKSYQQYMHDNIWSICNMHQTDIEEFGKHYENKSKLYKKGSFGFSEDKLTNLSIKYPAGGVQSTSGDMLRFAMAINKDKLITKKTKLMSFDLPNIEQHLKYGLGWIIEEDNALGLLHYHDGHQSGTSTQFIMIPSKGIGIIVLINSSESNDEAHTIARKLLEIYTRE